LVPNCEYSVSFSKLAEVHMQKIKERGCIVRTMPLDKDIKRLRLLVLSCDWPGQLEDNDVDPWTQLAERCRLGECDVMLHLGDQVYTWGEGRMMSAVHDMEDVARPEVTKELRLRMEYMAGEKLQESYRMTWTRPDCASALAHSSHLMIWSDNDVTNDFTVDRRPDGSQEFLPEFLSVGMRVYRMYQRTLWDPECITNQDELEAKKEVQEWHFHTYGPCGIFFIDMRGNRITPTGVLREGLPPLMSEQQRRELAAIFEQPGLSCLILCAEIPFVGPDPVSVKTQGERMCFMKDHWPYNLDELLWLLDLCFSWKAKVPGREVLMMAGDIHVGVDSIIEDKVTGLSIRSITTSPVTNKPNKFFPDLEGTLNDRYSYRHTPMEYLRNFCAIDLEFDGGTTKAKVELIGVPNTK